MTDHQDLRRIPVYVVLPPRTLLLDLAGPLEVLRVANRVQQAIRFDVHYVGPADSVLTSIGIALTGIEPLPRSLPGDAMVVVAGDVGEVMSVGRQFEAADDDRAGEAAIVAWLRAVVQPSHKLVCICSGALLAGRAGLLDGYTCTTHHSCCADLAKLAPKAKVLENRIYVEDGERFTSAGVTAGIDLMLYLVRRIIGDTCAVAIARYLVVYLRRSGTDPQLSPWLEARNHVHPAVHRVQDAIASDPTKPLTIKSLARIAGSSRRHLSRLFKEHAGISLTDYRNRLRVALARELLGNTQLDMEHVAERSGFASARQLRRVWRRVHPTSPKAARS